MSSDRPISEKDEPGRYIGLIPAAGVGSRLPDITSSKELLPFGSDRGQKIPVIAHLLSSFGEAGISDVRVVLRTNKSDIRNYLETDEWRQFTFTIEETPGTAGVPETVSLGLLDIPARSVAFGFPDILFTPPDAFVTLGQRLAGNRADVVLGLFPPTNPTKMDMVSVDDGGRVLTIDIKPERPVATLCWILAVWTPEFSRYLVDHVGITERANDHLGEVFQDALRDGMRIDSVAFPGGRALDIGTPDELNLAAAWPD